MRVLLPLAALLPLCAPPVLAQTGPDPLRWRTPDATGEAAWRALQAENPDLAADARAARFRPARGLRQIAVDLDGDGRAEVLLRLDLPGWCGTAGCAVFVLTRGADGAWREVCMTNAYAEDGIRLHPRDASGWRGFDATARVTFERAPDGGVTCKEDPLPRRR
ncbi:hypothetical protein GCM10010964_22340 [Caldovatus sediminis]|uniref:Uncharacterized protein n=1 Tax=Caldovatus sediminis TaxID=2041189 RepID=A0A8J2ZB00_9PROT|nr:hypothetical protein [Caldovatus sediminis]GGG33944.1 hypothetical protein GCM10010964_22340 [Caldovatus sediminis]